MKLRIGLVALALLGLVAYFFWPDRGALKPSEQPAAEGTDRDSSNGLSAIKVMSVAEESLRLNSPESGAGEDVVILELLLTHYRRAFEKNPVGLNHEVTRALVGGNEKRAAFLSPKHPAISESGELLDRWGNPFFFHQISGTEMEVVSAGPDGQLWTADDVKSE